MQRFNLIRPLIIIVVAFAVNNLAAGICAAFGLDQRTTDMVAVLAMVAAALYTYTRLTRNRTKK